MLTYFGLSETGPVREENQDAILLPDEASGSHPDGTRWLFALADGMGGYAHGGAASRVALQALQECCGKPELRAGTGALKRALNAANLAVCNEAARLGASRIGTTLTAVWLDGARLHLAHIGDSRAYLLRRAPGTEDGSEVNCLTQDHSVVGDLLRMRVIAPNQVRTHARRSILTKAVGLGLFIQPDLASIDLRAGDRLVLCSDGVWSVIEDEEFSTADGKAAGMDQATNQPRELCRALIDLALERGSDDNVSAIVIDIHDLPGPAQAKKAGKLFQILRKVHML